MGSPQTVHMVMRLEMGGCHSRQVEIIGGETPVSSSWMLTRWSALALEGQVALGGEGRRGALHLALAA